MSETEIAPPLSLIDRISSSTSLEDYLTQITTHHQNLLLDITPPTSDPAYTLAHAKNKMCMLLNALPAFGPGQILSFDQEAFNAIAAVDESRFDTPPLPEAEARQMLDVAIKAGFLHPIQKYDEEQYYVDEKFFDLILPLVQEYEAKLDIFKKRFEVEFTDIVSFYEPDGFLVLRPADMGSADDQRDINALSHHERIITGETAIKVLKIKPKESLVHTYSIEGPLKEDGTPSHTTVNVYTSNHEKGICLHEVRYEDGSILYALGAEDMTF